MMYAKIQKYYRTANKAVCFLQLIQANKINRISIKTFFKMVKYAEVNIGKTKRREK